MKTLVHIAIGSLLVGTLTGCFSKDEPPSVAIAHLNPTQGNKVTGTIVFTQTSKGIRILADVTDLTPGEHGFHIHEKGDCSAPDGTSAGGHFNPSGMPHGAPEAEKRHAGDLGNLIADATGKAHIDRIDRYLTFDGPGSIIGKAVIVHEKKDDLTSQPSGNAGPRVACGVIDWQK